MAVHRLSNPTRPAAPATLAQRMDRLRSDASAVASEHVSALVMALAEASTIAEQVANGGDAYHIGVREIARRTYKELAPVVLSLRAVHERRV
jgi:hypothetical protein